MNCRIFLALLIGVLILPGCASLLPNPQDERQYFVIEDDMTLPDISSGVGSSGGTIPIDLLVRDTRANRFINSDKIIFAEDAQTRGLYQLAQWVEPPPKRIAAMILSRLDRSGVFRSVAHLSSGTVAQFQVNSEAIEFFHDISDSPGTARVTILAEIVDLSTRSVIARRQFAKSVEVEEYSAAGAVNGLTAATNQMLNELTEWVIQTIRELKK